MRIKILILLLIILNTTNVISQNKRDYKWVMGNNLVGLEGGDIIDFDNNRSIDTGFIAFPMGANCVNICDKDGNLLMYSNGCAIADKTHHIMEGGDSINYGSYWEKHCAPKYNAGYPGSHNTIILPEPSNDNIEVAKYFLIHKKLTLKKDPLRIYAPILYYSKIDINDNKGKGKVIKKNIPIFKTRNLLNGYMTACKHANGKDWWIIQMEKDTNIYFKILLTKDTIMVVDSQSIGPNFSLNSSNSGQAVFTPDGSKWLCFNPVDKVLIYDFDRATGELSNLRRVNPQDSGRFVGIAVSSNSRFAYLSAKYDLYQIDLWEDDIQSSLVHIAHIDGFRDPTWPSTFSLAQLGPDCKIYIVNGGTNNYLHVINKPNEKGKACDFRQHAFYLPNRNYNGSLPNFPHFRIDEDQICDSTITWIPDEYIVKRINTLSVYPNPTPDIATISLYSESFEYGKIEILDINGRVMQNMDIDTEATKEINVQNYVPGVYMVRYISADGRKMDNEKLIVE